jgi:hypothetical protein
MGQIRNLRADVTHWVSTPDGYGGYTFAAPAALKGRWEDKTELFRNPAGEEDVSEAIVYISSDVAVADYLFEGVSTAADPTLVAEARQIKQFHKTPNLRHLSHDRKAFL